MFCDKCGQECLDDAKFCTKCGNQFAQQQADQQPPVQQQQPIHPNQQQPNIYGQQNQQPPNQYQQPNQQPFQYQQPPPYQPTNQYGQPPYGGNPNQIYKRAGKTLIMVTGIILTVFGALGFFITLGSLGLSDYLPDGWGALLVFELLTALLTLVFGIMGIVFASKKDKASVVMAFGGTLIALKVIDLIWAMGVMGEYLDASTIFGVLAGCVLPLLYIIGGNTRKNAQW